MVTVDQATGEAISDRLLETAASLITAANQVRRAAGLIHDDDE
jgi:hypothetical protein